MPRCARAGLLLLLPLTACSAVSPTLGAPEEPRQTGLLQLERQMFDAIRTRDVGALNRLLSEDFELRVPGEAAVGREAFIASVRAIPGTLLEVDSDDTQARVLGDVGMLSGHQRARVKLVDGSIVTQRGVFADVARWVGGRWIFVHAYNVNEAETAPNR